MARRRKLPPEQLVPFPGFEPKTNYAGEIIGSQYYLSNHGVVYSVDGSVPFNPETPTFDDQTINPFARGVTMNVKLAGGAVTRSLPKAIAQAFATVKRPPTDKDNGTWIATIHPDAFDREPLRCSVVDVYWTPYSERCLWSRGTRKPKSDLLIPII